MIIFIIIIDSAKPKKSGNTHNNKIFKFLKIIKINVIKINEEGVIMKNFYKDKKFNFSVEDLKRRVFLEAAATAMLANLKLRKQKS